MSESSRHSLGLQPWIKTLIVGSFAGVLAGIAMLLTMALLRLFLGWPTPTELIFDRIFPLLTVEFFIGSLVRAGGYTPLKLQGVFGALAGQVVVAGLGGELYAFYLRSRDRRGGLRTWGTSLVDPRGLPLIIPGILATTMLFIALLWPTLLTNYRGFPAGTARVIASLEMLISFSVCGVGIMVFYGLLSGPSRAAAIDQGAIAFGEAVGRRRFVALGIGTAFALALGGTLRRLFWMGTFSYDGRQYGGPRVQKITPIRPKDQFYQVSKNLIGSAKEFLMHEHGCEDSRKQIVSLDRAHQCRRLAAGCSSIHWRTRRDSVGEAVTSKRRNRDLDARRGARTQSAARVASTVEDRRSVESPSARHRRERMHLRPAALRVSCSLRRRMGRIAAQFIETIYLVWPHRTLDPGSSRAHEQQLVDPRAGRKKLETASSPCLRRCRGAHLSSGDRRQRALANRTMVVVPACRAPTSSFDKDSGARKSAEILLCHLLRNRLHAILNLVLPGQPAAGCLNRRRIAPNAHPCSK